MHNVYFTHELGGITLHVLAQVDATLDGAGATEHDVTLHIEVSGVEFDTNGIFIQESGRFILLYDILEQKAIEERRAS